MQMPLANWEERPIKPQRGTQEIFGKVLAIRRVPLTQRHAPQFGIFVPGDLLKIFGSSCF